MTQGMRALAIHFIDVVFKHRCAGIEDIVTSSFAWKGPALLGKSGGGAEELRNFSQTLHAAMPDLTVSTEDFIVEGNRVAVRWTVRGRHTGKALAAPTGVCLQFTGIHLLKVADHDSGSPRIAEMWQQWGQMGLLQHLQIIPFIGGPGSELPGPTIEGSEGAAQRDVPTQHDMTAENRAMIQRLFDEVINKGNLALANEWIAENVKDHNPGPSDLPGREGIKEVCKLLRIAFPDFSGAIDEMITEGDKVVVRWTVHGTNTCKCGGIPATCRAMTGTGIDIVRIGISENGQRQVTDRWGNSDDTGILLQLGIIPAFS